MQLDFFPSRTVTFYLARVFIVRIVAMLFVFVLVLQMLDLLGQTGKILAYPGNGQAALWHYVALHAPYYCSRFLPYSVLLASIITLATLNQNSEVIAMKSAGMSAHQVLAPLLLTALAVSVVSLAFNELVVTRTTATLHAWSDANFGPIPTEADIRRNVYLADGTDILTASTVTGSGKNMVMNNVTFYHRDAKGMIAEQIRSPRATFADPGWQLESPTQFSVEFARSEKIEPLVVAPGVTPDKVSISSVDPEAQNFVELRRSIDLLTSLGRGTAELRGMWWHKFSGPLSVVLMPLLGAVAAFGLARSGHLFIRAIIGMALGFAYFVVDNAALAMGNFGGYPPLLAAWAPFFLFFLVGEMVLIRTEE